MQETPELRIRSLGREDPMEVGMATYSSVLAWRIPWTEEPGGLQTMGSQRAGPDCSDSASKHAGTVLKGLLWCLKVKNPPANVTDSGSIPEPGRSPGKGSGNPPQYSCLGSPMEPGGLQSVE